MRPAVRRKWRQKYVRRATWLRRPAGRGRKTALGYSEPNALISAASASVSSRGTSPCATFAACT